MHYNHQGTIFWHVKWLNVSFIHDIPDKNWTVKLRYIQSLLLQLTCLLWHRVISIISLILRAEDMKIKLQHETTICHVFLEVGWNILENIHSCSDVPAFISDTVYKLCFVNGCLYLRLDTRTTRDRGFIYTKLQSARMLRKTAEWKKEKEQGLLQEKIH